MHQFVRNLITEWRRLDLPFGDKTLVVAVSGGADSVSLLLAIHDLIKRKKLSHRIIAAHLNHRLRGAESDADEEFVRSLTGRLKIELSVKRADIPTTGNLEQNARDVRYSFLRETAAKLDAFAILTGHTINDQAETFLMNLLRGSGVVGLTAMREVREIELEVKSLDPLLPHISPTLQLVRPLLKWAKRINTEEFCRDLDVEYRYDTMNEDTAFKRVRIRKILLPLLEDFNPRIVETLANTAGLMQAISNKSATDVDFPNQEELQLAEIKKLAKPELYVVIRAWLAAQRGNTRQLGLKHIEAIERLIHSSKSGRTAELPGGQVTKSGGKLVYDKN